MKTRVNIRSDLTIIISAAGTGQRLGLGSKAMLQLEGRSLLHWLSAKALRVAAEVIVAVPPGKHEVWAPHCEACKIIDGGETHLASTARLASVATNRWIMNLNVSLPFVSIAMMHQVAEAAKITGIAGAFVPLDLPLASIDNGTLQQIFSSKKTGIAQGPNVYSREHLLAIIARADSSDWGRQSFLEIAIRHGYKITAVPGEKTNIKITTAQDWQFAQFLALQNEALFK